MNEIHAVDRPSVEEFSKLFKRYRRRLGVTQKELAATIGVSPRTLSRWADASSASLPRWDHLQQLVVFGQRHGHYHHLFDFNPGAFDRSIHLLVENRRGVLAHVSLRIAGHQGDIERATTKRSRDRKIGYLGLEVNFAEYPAEVLHELCSFSFVIAGSEYDSDRHLHSIGAPSQIHRLREFIASDTPAAHNRTELAATEPE